MSRVSFTVLKHLPIRFWLIVGWCAMQAVPLLVVSIRLDGHAAQAAVLASLLQLALAGGMLLRLGWVRRLLILYLAGCLFAGTMVVAVFRLLYVYIGLAHI